MQQLKRADQWETDPAVIFRLSRDLRLTWCNAAWDRFAAANGGVGLERRRQVGRPVMDVVPAPLNEVYAEGYRKVLAEGQIWEHCYECSSADQYRIFRMMTYPDAQNAGCVVVNSLIVELPHDRTACAPGEGAYLSDDGIVTMCCHCRRTRRVDDSAAWDWTPAYLAAPPPRVSHAICGICLAMLYPKFPVG